ncbi:hypothetical protein H4219_003284 [Mycoemilia scoparia]|uniref:Uncharacterized protein n=1 Tax=Mycoemilia scoparia TaxID=417184 RepID=A0A9W8A394_9FUNG|nr:hypothetical protein H4219_003284 [Mycoemilia scoparia]
MKTATIALAVASAALVCAQQTSSGSSSVSQSSSVSGTSKSDSKGSKSDSKDHSKSGSEGAAPQLVAALKNPGSSWVSFVCTFTTTLQLHCGSGSSTSSVYGLVLFLTSNGYGFTIYPLAIPLKRIDITSTALAPNVDNRQDWISKQTAAQQQHIDLASVSHFMALF